MKRIFFLFFLCCMTTLTTFAQEKKTYTLEDVIPGGNNYFNLVPENIPGLQWWGDVCVRAGGKYSQHSVERWQGNHTCHTERGKSSY